jgi:hypothetical protein
VVRRVIDAILQNETTVMIPWHMGLTSKIVKVIFPDSVKDWLFDQLRFTSGMDTFKGRR